ncbi:hypothetical protein [Thiocystis minor]|uniref:hypothetical protein n=1 Tax=Thiocystis minor TaxID=61597 RepID=UPI003B835F10
MVVHAIHLNQHRRKASADRQADRARKYLVTKKEETGNRPGEGLLLTFDHRQYAVMMVSIVDF